MSKLLIRGTGIWPLPVSALAVLAILGSTIGRPVAPAAAVTAPTRPAAAAAPARVQPALARLAAAHPTATVRVIVQETARATGVATLIPRLGGHVTQALSIIHAIVATLPAQAAAQVAATPGVRWVSLDGPVASMTTATPCTSCNDPAALQSTYVRAIGADQVWSATPSLQGQGIGVAVVDSGINADLPDLQGANGPSGWSRVVDQATFNSTTHSMADRFGHGTAVAGVIGGNGAASGGAYVGVAPAVNLINVKVSDETGGAAESDVVAGLQWVLTNAARDNIRVVNLSLNTTTAQSYNQDPLDAACEILWTHKIVVVVSAGNNGGASQGVLYPPANDPFVITVGAVDDHGTAAIDDDTLASFSAFGTTPDGIAKPELVAPGVDIVSTLASRGTILARQHPDHLVGNAYIRISGTSMAAPIVAGAAALLLQSNPTLTPDQIKYRLVATARPLGPGTGAGEVDVPAAVQSTATASANTGLQPSRLLAWAGPSRSGTAWDSMSWGSMSWGSMSWGSMSWGSMSWGSDYWGP